MSDFVYKDYLPANSRVIVDYTRKEKVGFSYPLEWTYWKAVWKRGYLTVLSFWLAINIYWVFLFTPLIVLGIIGYFVFLIFNPITKTIAEYTYTISFMTHGLPLILLMFYLLGIPALLTFWLSLDKERMSRWFPKLGYWSAKIIYGTKEKIFTKEDISEDKVIIPSFSNVFLDYKTTGDFNKFLQKIEILEIPFDYKTRRFWLPFLSKKEKNDYDFRAVFYFSQKPMEGSLDVEFI